MSYIRVIKEKLAARFKMTDLESAQHYLSIEIIRISNSILLRQRTYLMKILERFDMNKCKSIESSMNSNLVNVMMSAADSQQAHSNIIHWFEVVVECFMYADTQIRSDLSYALSLISRYLHNSDFTHVTALQHIFRYVKYTLDYDVEYEYDIFYEFFDADWAEAKDDQCFTEDYIFIMCEDSISWFFKRQNAVAKFSCEFEYYVLFEVGSETVWLRRLLIELNHITSQSLLIWADNQDVIALIENSEFHKRTKHIDVKWHWIREQIQKKIIQIEYVLIKLMVADDLTKPLESKEFNRFLALIGMAYYDKRYSGGQVK